MNEVTKTAAFLIAAAAMLIAAVVTGYRSQPKPADDQESIGQPFYTDFEQTDQAKSLMVTSIDPDTVREQKFEIKQVDGLWQIPSHEGYPAEAAERLAKTSASLLGLTRDSRVGRRTSDYEKFGVVDPRSEDIVDIESVGQSITLRDANEDVLVDLIIGDRADEADEDSSEPPNNDDSFYYVRRADETNVYRIPLNIELSTKFADWIEPDLLQIEAADVVDIDLNNYQIEERSSGMFGQVKQLMKIPGDKLSIQRPSSTDDWELEGLDPAKESVRQDAVNAIVSVLDDMAIVDVKKKPTLDGRILLDADLNYSVTPEQAKLMSIRTQQDLEALSPSKLAEFQALQRGIMELQRDLDSRGFSFGMTGQKLELVSTGGEMQAGTSDGLRYTLHVGKAPTKKTSEIKVGGAKDDDGDDAKADSEGEESKSNDEGDNKGEDGDTASEKEKSTETESDEEGQSDDSRYVLIRVAFDPTLLDSAGERPTEPSAPTKPEGYTEATESSGPETSDDESEETSEEDATEAGDEEDGGDEDSAPKPANMERNPAFVKYDMDLAAFEESKMDYEVALSTWESATEEQVEQTKLGKRKAEILNGRFEKWYYIVSSENLKTLQSDREELTDPVAAATEGQGGANPNAGLAPNAPLKAIPDISYPEIDIPADADKTEDTDESATETEPAAPIEKPAVGEAPSASESEAPAEEGEAETEGGEMVEEKVTESPSTTETEESEETPKPSSAEPTAPEPTEPTESPEPDATPSDPLTSPETPSTKVDSEEPKVESVDEEPDTEVSEN